MEQQFEAVKKIAAAINDNPGLLKAMHEQGIQFAELPEDHYLQPASPEKEETAVCSTCAEVMADIYKSVFLRETAKIEFGPAAEDEVMTMADWDRVIDAAERARMIAQTGLTGYQEGMRRITEQDYGEGITL